MEVVSIVGGLSPSLVDLMEKTHSMFDSSVIIKAAKPSGGNSDEESVCGAYSSKAVG